MGTRNLTTIKYNGETKAAQYGQWDGYPSGIGIDILETLRASVSSKSPEGFFLRDNLKRTRFLTQEEVDHINWRIDNEGIEIKKTYPLLHRDNAGNVLLNYLTEERHEETLLYDDSEFAENGLFCEYHYEIDLDAGIFTVNNNHSWTFNNLPTMDEFYEAFE